MRFELGIEREDTTARKMRTWGCQRMNFFCIFFFIYIYEHEDIADEPKNDREVPGFTYRRWAQTNEPDCLRSARMASYMQAACSLAVKQNGNLILDLNISTVIPHQSPK